MEQLVPSEGPFDILSLVLPSWWILDQGRHCHRLHWAIESLGMARKASRSLPSESFTNDSNVVAKPWVDTIRPSSHARAYKYGLLPTLFETLSPSPSSSSSQTWTFDSSVPLSQPSPLTLILITLIQEEFARLEKAWLSPCV
jgi:hypothetical protein